MTRQAARSILTFLMVAVLVAVSVVSASLMAPDRETLERQAVARALGTPIAEFCGVTEDGHDHRCPFCHKLPDPPRLTAPDAGRRITRVIVDRLGRDLVVGHRHLRPQAAPRAPPRLT
ncbi:hypothetical protein EKE94_11790 [Mesobaculum littorinae]|uniref:Uncharacterized protein n=1 Tax=Mesobaculum littorinae TaxID=2486419 RepID=A0A438AHF1_9RHOB|nr:hypothetical protein [Mesobaculum littorinae]RVV98126.1 hypothetical protein EKE94_11790 [Mesobaculum littorinae]